MCDLFSELNIKKSLGDLVRKGDFIAVVNKRTSWYLCRRIRNLFLSVLSLKKFVTLKYILPAKKV